MTDRKPINLRVFMLNMVFIHSPRSGGTRAEEIKRIQALETITVDDVEAMLCSVVQANKFTDSPWACYELICERLRSAVIHGAVLSPEFKGMMDRVLEHIYSVAKNHISGIKVLPHQRLRFLELLTEHLESAPSREGLSGLGTMRGYCAGLLKIMGKTRCIQLLSERMIAYKYDQLTLGLMLVIPDCVQYVKIEPHNRAFSVLLTAFADAGMTPQDDHGTGRNRALIKVMGISQAIRYSWPVLRMGISVDEACAALLNVRADMQPIPIETRNYFNEELILQGVTPYTMMMRHPNKQENGVN